MKATMDVPGDFVLLEHFDAHHVFELHMKKRSRGLVRGRKGRKRLSADRWTRTLLLASFRAFKTGKACLLLASPSRFDNDFSETELVPDGS